MKHKRRNIVLIGFMGSGKTTLGLKLSYLLRMPVDRRAGASHRSLRMTVNPISGNWRRNCCENAGNRNTNVSCLWEEALRSIR